MVSPIRVLCVFATLDCGGAESMCMNIYRQINRSRVQFDFVKHTPNKGELEEEIQSLGGKIIEAPRYRIINKIQYEEWWRSFFRQHPEYRIIHGHFFSISSVYFRIAHEFGLHTVGHSHNVKLGYPSLKLLFKMYYVRRVEKESDTCFACSKAAGEYVFRHKKYIVVHNAIDSKKFAWNEYEAAKIRRGLGVGPEKLIIGTCGSLTHQKNPFGILEIFKSIHSKNRNTLLLWIGDGKMRKQIEGRIQQLNLSDAVLLTGARTDVYRVMQAMDVFILPSFWEGLALVSVEAQAAGLPCYFSDTITKECAITDLVQFLPLNDPETWSDRILADKGIRKDTIKDIVSAGYDIVASAQWLEDFYMSLYEKLINKKRI